MAAQYNHSLVSYAPLHVIEKALEFHSEEIKGYAFIRHDKFTEAELKDDGTEPEPHFHIIVRLWRRLSPNTVKRWFWCIDEDGQLVNTLNRQVGSVPIAYDYLIHKWDPEKWQYSPSERVVSDPKWFTVDECIEEDNAFLAFQMALCDVEPYVIAKRIGKDFLYHSRSIYESVAYKHACEVKHRYNGGNILRYDGLGNVNPDYLKELKEV